MVRVLRVLIGLLIIAFLFYGSVELSFYSFGEDGTLMLGRFIIIMLGLIAGMFFGFRIMLGKRGKE